MRTIQIKDAEIFIEPVREHRFVFILRAQGLEATLSDTDPYQNGVAPLPLIPTQPGGEKAAQLINQFLDQARILLAGKQPANMIMLRGFDKLPHLPTFKDLYGMRAAAIALYGMYRGVAKLVGMQILDTDRKTLEGEFSALEKYWNDYDFFYLHVKQTDLYGEVGNFNGKVKAIEEVDGMIPRLLHLHPDVIVISGDHSTPAVLSAHSWHPVPTMIYGKNVRPDGICEFGERACLHGSLGLFPAKDILSLALANANRITKYGA